MAQPLVGEMVPGDSRLAFEVCKGRLSSKRAYVIEHVNETKSSIGRRWQQARKKTSITRDAGRVFNIDNVVAVSFDRGPLQYAMIKEIREARDEFLVVQWSYSLEEAIEVYAPPATIGSWPRDTYVLSNHFQVVTAENIEEVGHVLVDQRLYFNATGSKDLRSLSGLKQKIDQQLTQGSKA